MKQGGQYYWYLNDHLGTPREMINGNGNVVWAATYDSFGKAYVDVENVRNNLRLAGQYFDVETGLHYNWHRYYDPSTGRYLTPDPIGLDGGMNLFVYAGANPIRNTDPTGLKCGSGWNDWVVPDSWWGKFNFEPACDGHDKCYGQCGMLKSQCDNNFYKNMLSACKGLTGTMRIHCESMATAYYNAVKNIGQSAYNSAQTCCQ